MRENSTRIQDELTEKAKAGDRKAFSQLVRLLMPKITALTYKMTGDNDAALDLAQDTFVSAWNNLKTFEGAAKIESWLYRIASNKSLNYIKREKRKAIDVDIELFETGQDPEVEMHQKELRLNVLNFMQSLPTEQRLVFELRFYKELTFEETAAATGKALGTVKTLYREAVKKLRDVARKQGWHA